jgi:hypothetical protein
VLQRTPVWIWRDQLRRACRMRTQTLCDALAELVRAGRVLKSEAGYRLA